MSGGLVIAGIMAALGLYLALRSDRGSGDSGAGRTPEPSQGSLTGLPLPSSGPPRTETADPGQLPGFSTGSTVIPDSPPELVGPPPPASAYADEYVNVPGNRSAENAFLGLDLSGVTGALVAGIGYAYGVRTPPDDIIYAIHGTKLPNLDPVLVRAIVNVETMRLYSWAQAQTAIRAETRHGDFLDWSVGPMQMRTDTAKWVAPFRELTREQIRDRLLNPYTAIAVGMKYLQLQLARYKSPPSSPWPREAWIAAAYNAGTAIYNFRTERFSNQLYVDRVLADMSKFTTRFPSRKGLIDIPSVLGG